MSNCMIGFLTGVISTWLTTGWIVCCIAAYGKNRKNIEISVKKGRGLP